MNSTAKVENDWFSSNQQYLSSILNVIKSRLQWYEKSIRDPDHNEASPDYYSSMEELQNQRREMLAPPAIEQLVNVLGLSAFERDVLVLCAGVELDSTVADRIRSLEKDSLLPSFSLALAAIPGSYWAAITPDRPLRYWRLIEMAKTEVVTRSPLKIDEHILHYLVGVGGLHEKLRRLITVVADENTLLPSHLASVEAIVKPLSKTKNSYSALPVIQLEGKDNSDMLGVASSVSKKLGLTLYAIDAGGIPGNQPDLYEVARLWNREAALNGYALFIDCTDLDHSDGQKALLFKNFIDSIYGLLIIGGNYPVQIRKPRHIHQLKKPTSSEQLNLWQKLAGRTRRALDLENFASQFDLSASTITKISNEFFRKGVKTDRDKMWKLCCDYARPSMDELAERIEPLARWSDIVLPDEQKLILQAIASQVRYKNKVYQQWGFSEKVSRGLGISVLFSGESGTGKTMAAEVLANELKLDLYKIDLSKVVNKYIGETEKNLKRIFDAAEDGGAILLFDEADALFGKRSEVKDSHDRYSNIEVSYLLQRMETYRGLAILTTNMRSALDKAFLRRIRFVVHFPFPDAESRKEIWRRIFPKKVNHKLDMEKLARLSLSGGSIRNIALNAAFFAAGDGDVISMPHISKAAKAEYDKLEKSFSSSELKP